MPGPRELMALVDLAIIAISIAVLIFLLLNGWLRSDQQSTSGRYLAVTGIAIMLLAGLANLVWLVFKPASFAMRGDMPALEGIPVWLFWFLTRFAFVLVASGIFLAIAQRRRLETKIQTARRQIRIVEEDIMQSEARFHQMIESTSESVYCFEFDPPLSVTSPVAEQIQRSHDAVLTECNQAFAKELGAVQPADVIGRNMGSLDSNNDAEAHYQYFKSFIESDYQLSDYDMIYKSPKGDDCAFQISLTGFGRAGFLEKMWGSEHSIQDLRQTQSALRARQQFQQLLADVSSRLVMAPNDNVNTEMRSCLEDVCLFLGADRISLFWIDWEKEIATPVYYWKKDGIAWDNDGAAEPISASIKKFPVLATSVRKAEVIRIDDISEMSGAVNADKKALEDIGLKSALIVPLIVAGENVGVLSLVHSKKKHMWTDQEVFDLRVFAELFANFVLRQNSYKALDDALNGLQRATDKLEAENVYLRQEIHSTHGFDEIVGKSGALLRCLHLVEQVAETITPVLILGETGTGKELIARALHEHSSRNERPLVKVNCAALPGNLIESELFGYEKGAFTGAGSRKRGRFDLANKGTLFLDEIGDIPVELQSKLLRVLQEGEFERLGGSETIKVDVRLIVATNHDLMDAVDKGEFRSDLYYRINTFPIALPALRDRGEDIQVLAEYFVKVHSQRLEREVNAISASMMEQLNEYPWPGNIRELESVIQRALISGSGPILDLAEPLMVRRTSNAGEPTIVSSNITDLRIVERKHILTALEQTAWKISGQSGAAATLGVPPSTLRSKMKRLSITRPH